MSKNIVIVIDKASQACNLHPIASSLYPNSAITFVSTLEFGLYDFKYPRHLKMHDFPITLNPEWKERHFIDGAIKACQVVDRKVVAIKDPIESVLNNANEVICAVSPDRTGIHAFMTLISHCCGDKAYNGMKALMIPITTKKAITGAFREDLSTQDEWFVKKYEEAKIKKYFDYNFNLNSAVIFGQVLSNVKILRSNFILSKNGLVILYYLKSVNQIQSEELLSKMSGQWIGTGKYQNGSVGSVISKWEIIFQLIDVGLVKYENGILSLSDKGELFLSQLHPDCCDLDLPFRIEAWCKDFANAGPRIDRYIRTIFGKQKKFFNKL